MGKLDVSCLRHLTKNDLRVLVAVEMGMKNHDLVPTDIIINIARLRHGGAHRFISNLHRFKLVYHEQKGYDGYRLTYAGYDMLALNAFINKGLIIGLGRKIGVGKESDVYLAQNPEGQEVVLKFNRLGRTSFRSIKRNRDYLVHRKSAGWLYMSRLAAMKEFAFMKALYDEGFPTPVPIECNRHVVLMSAVPGFPMSQVKAGQMENPMIQLGRSLDILVRLAKHGLIHCDLNEFNLMVSRTGEVTVIDFPQMISTSHLNAAYYFDRDVSSIIKFFKMKMKITIPDDEIPTFSNILKEQLEAEEALKEEEEEDTKDVNDDDKQEEVEKVEGSGDVGKDEDKIVTQVNNLVLDVNKEDTTIEVEENKGAEEQIEKVKVPKVSARTLKKQKRLEKTSKQIRLKRLDEVVKASGFISVKQDEYLLSYIEEQRVAVEEALLLGEQPDSNSDDSDDDVLREVDNEDDEEEEEPRILIGAGNTEEEEEEVSNGGSRSTGWKGVGGNTNDNEYDMEEETEEEAYDRNNKGILRDLNPQDGFVKVKGPQNKFDYNKLTRNTNRDYNNIKDSNGDGGDGDEDSDEEDGSIRAGWTKEGGDSIASSVSDTSSTSTHSRGYHGQHFRPQRHRNKQQAPEGKRNNNKITYRGSKLHKPKATY